ncbi:hypothetical protein RGU70_08450 [Herbaspirillum sp. RTI4]|uniref:surface-adhesin E family protein n=1 Tax=Herbaspirillum sp. RTI4 TaxID=3048640 RepID=UPI002AB3F941|nr:surface-adhesin E family protein [Herbaspirillum sp. RTI4]MDY7578350.1 hypothetical protein [Herbaspirillum sp. RTI4]MEA9981157.1 hypothetical protein [Herbaspirillum sp. RTI4]
MKKFLLLTLLPLLSLSAYAADWQVVGGTDKSQLTIDVQSIKDAGSMRQALSMWNFTEPRANSNDSTFPFLKSYQDLHTYNCNEKTMRLTQEVIYSENDAKGDKRDHSDALKGMTYAKPAANSVGDIMLQLVCGYKLASKNSK